MIFRCSLSEAASLRCGSPRWCSKVPAAAASKSAMLGADPLSKYERRLAILWPSSLRRPVVESGFVTSKRYRKLADCSIPEVAVARPCAALLPVTLAAVRATVVQAVISSAVSVRRNAWRPNLLKKLGTRTHRSDSAFGWQPTIGPSVRRLRIPRPSLRDWQLHRLQQRAR